MPRQVRGLTSKTSRDALLRRPVALAAHRAAVLVLDLGPAALQLHARAMWMPSSRSSGSKPVTTMGTR